MVPGVTGVGERIAHQVEGDGDDGNDGRREPQGVRGPREHGPGGGQQVAQGGHHDVHETEIGEGGLIGDGVGETYNS